MSRDFHERASEQFLRAVALEGDDRARFLDSLRAANPELCREVESLLGNDDRAPTILDPGEPLRLLASSVPAPSQVGPYHVLEEIGEGGMGVVYRAERREPIQLEVALKLIKPGLETRRVLARFEAERRVLALMDHPGIARVYDAGLVQGRPYVAMEYVRGEAITRFCDHHCFRVRKRLRLFLSVCDAVQHAHRNAIIHRDLKPSNVLVAVQDGMPVPKVIDFGIAKALSPEPQTGGTLTVAGEFVGTPAYISPEQAAGQIRNIDVRADVYSLGAMLYELLTGEPPIDPRRLPEGDVTEIRRVILTEDPPPPSRRVAGVAERAAQAASDRQVDVEALARSLRGDLDAIVMKAIAKEPDRRYGSVRELADDVRRHLEEQPIAARPPTAAYRLRKAVRRHPRGAAVVAVTIPLVVGFALVMAIQARRLAVERDRAREVSELIVGLVGAPYSLSGRHVPPEPKEVFLRASEKVEREMGDWPVLQARVQHSIGETMRSIGATEEAIPVLEGSVRRLTALLGGDDAAALAAAGSLAQAYADLNRFAEAEPLFVRVLQGRTRVLGPAAPDTLRAARALGFLYKSLGRSLEAAPLLARAAEGLRGGAGESEEALTAASLAGAVYLDLRDLDEAKRWLEWAIPKMEPGLREKGIAVYNLACIHALQGRPEPALRLLRESQALNGPTGYFGDLNLQPLFDNPEFIRLAQAATASGPNYEQQLIEWATLAIGAGRADDAEAIYRYLLAILPPQQSGPIQGVMQRLRRLLVAEGRYAEALPIAEREVEAVRRLGIAGNQTLMYRLASLYQIRYALGDLPGALAAIDEAIGLWEAIPGPTPHARATYLRASREAALGNLDAAERLFVDAVDHGFIDEERLWQEVALRRLEGRREFERAKARLERRQGPFADLFTAWPGRRPAIFESRGPGRRPAAERMPPPVGAKRAGD